MRKCIKELVIIALLIVVIMSILGILLSDYVPANISLPEPIEYMADSSVTAVLQEIETNTEENGNGNIDSSENTESLLKSYSIDESELKSYKSKNAFASGKPDPFADYEETTESNTVTGGQSSVITNTITGTTSKPNTGSFFESSNSK